MHHLYRELRYRKGLSFLADNLILFTIGAVTVLVVMIVMAMGLDASVQEKMKLLLN